MKRLKKRKWLKDWVENIAIALIPVLFLILTPIVLNTLYSEKLAIRKILFDAFAGGEMVMCAIAILISAKPPSSSSPFNGLRWVFIAFFSLAFGLLKSQVFSHSADYEPNSGVVYLSLFAIFVSAFISFLMMKPDRDSRKDETSMSGEQGGQGRNGVQTQTEVQRGGK